MKSISQWRKIQKKFLSLKNETPCNYCHLNGAFLRKHQNVYIDLRTMGIFLGFNTSLKCQNLEQSWQNEHPFAILSYLIFSRTKLWNNYFRHYRLNKNHLPSKCTVVRRKKIVYSQELWTFYAHLEPNTSVIPTLCPLAPNCVFCNERNLTVSYIWASWVAQWKKKKMPASAGEIEDHRPDSQVRKILWIRKWQPASIFLPGKFHGQKSLVGYSPWDGKESDRLSMHTCTYALYNISKTTLSIPATKEQKCFNSSHTEESRLRILTLGAPWHFHPPLAQVPHLW